VAVVLWCAVVYYTDDELTVPCVRDGFSADMFVVTVQLQEDCESAISSRDSTNNDRQDLLVRELRYRRHFPAGSNHRAVYLAVYICKSSLSCGDVTYVLPAHPRCFTSLPARTRYASPSIENNGELWSSIDIAPSD
jgi:hypothetical protein